MRPTGRFGLPPAPVVRGIQAGHTRDSRRVQLHREHVHSDGPAGAQRGWGIRRRPIRRNTRREALLEPGAKTIWAARFLPRGRHEGDLFTVRIRSCAEPDASAGPLNCFLAIVAALTNAFRRGRNRERGTA
jgi:hypothetical protein